MAFETETQRVAVLVDKLGQEPDLDLKVFVTPITKALEGLERSIDAYRAANEVELQAFGRIEQEKFAWFDLYKLDHRTLAQMFCQDAKKADSYFKSARRAKAKVTPVALPPVDIAPSQEATA